MDMQQERSIAESPEFTNEAENHRLCYGTCWQGKGD
jgi:hypothetical protein